MATSTLRKLDFERDALEAARALAPRIRESGAEIEARRRLPTAIVEAMREAGLFHMTVPRDLGGRETDPVEHLRVVEEIAAADGSAGWCVMIACQVGPFAAFMDPVGAREVMGNGNLGCGVARPIGRAVPLDDPAGGYRVSGHWPFASGSAHADWFMGECLIYDDDGDSPRKKEDGDDAVLTFFTPAANATVHDTWYTTGLRGTSSNNFSVEDVVVPPLHAVDFSGPPTHPWAALRVEPLIFMNHGAHALGIARAAVEEATRIIREKRGWGNVPLRETGRMQQVIAEATALHESSKAYFYSAAEALWAAAQGTEAVDAVTRARARLAASHAATASIQAVDLLHRALATSAILATSTLDRQFRDIHTAAAHVMIGPLTYEAAGRALLGDEVNFPLF
jgi:alkylation response protein AidB-like acyl-CoA dehydrogenase